jgi:hypothetical protein
VISTDTTVDAVNRILSSIGDSPVNSIEDPTNVNVINAIALLDKINRQEQAKGWSFNSIDSYTLNPDNNTHLINWSSTYLRLKSQNGDRLTRKGAYVYNFTTQSFIFSSNVIVEAILLVDLDDMPEAMKNYIVASASEQFQAKYLGDPNLAEGLLNERKEAWASLQEYEMEMNDYNMLENAEIVQIVGE